MVSLRCLWGSAVAIAIAGVLRIYRGDHGFPVGGLITIQLARPISAVVEILLAWIDGLCER